MEDKDYKISEQMTDYLCNFAKNGDPNGQHQPTWNPVSEKKQVLLIGENPTRMGKANNLKLTAIMLTNKAVGE